MKLRAELRTSLQQREDALREPVLGWTYRPRLQHELADCFEKLGRKIQQTTLSGVERVAATSKSEFDLVDQCSRVIIVALLKELVEAVQDSIVRVVDGDSRV